MALTGLQIFKLLPGTNCRDCGYPTCLAFAMKLAAGKESLDNCPEASDELKAALGAASAPPIRRVTIGSGERAITVGEETVFFRHDKTFVNHPGLFRMLDSNALSLPEIEALLDEWVSIELDRAGEIFRVDGVAIVASADGEDRFAEAAEAAAERGLPIALLAATPGGVRQAAEKVGDHRPLVVPPLDTDQAPYVKVAAEFKLPIVVSAESVEDLALLAEETAKAGVSDILLGPSRSDPARLHESLSQIRRGALERVHPGLGHPVFLHVPQGQFEKAVIGITKFASILVIEDHGGETWLPLWTLRQNIYTDPQKPLQIDPGIYSIGEPNENSPLLVTSNFSLTYFIVSTELDGTGVPCFLAVVEAEGMSILTAWSAGKFSGEKVAKELRKMGATERVRHKTAIIPGLVAVISGEMEDALGDGWRVVTGPQEASDLGPFFREFLGS